MSTECYSLSFPIILTLTSGQGMYRRAKADGELAPASGEENGNAKANSNKKSERPSGSKKTEKGSKRRSSSKAESTPNSVAEVPSDVNFQLVYFSGVAGRAELIRLILTYGDVPYEEKLLGQADWAMMKEDAPTESLPILKKGGATLGQSKCIARFLANEVVVSLAGECDFKKAQLDMIADIFDGEIYNHFLRAAFAVIMKNETNAMEDFCASSGFRGGCEKLNKHLQQNGTNYLVSDQVSWVDLWVGDTLVRLLDKWDSMALDHFMELRDLALKIKDEPKLVDFFKTRTEHRL